MGADRPVELLLVDDRADGLIALNAVLKDENYGLVSARSGVEALGLIDHHDFACILLDVQMPGMDGFETARRVRARARHAQIPILFVTAINKDDRYVHRGYEAGAVDYIFKPFDPVVLKAKVNVFVNLHLSNRRLAHEAHALAAREALKRREQIQSVEVENQRRYRNLADSIPHIVLRTRPDGDLEYHNHLWTEFTGFSLSDSLGAGWQSAVRPESLGELLREWPRSMNERVHYEGEFGLRRYDGVYRWHWIKAVPELDDDGEVIAWLATCTDIQERKSAEELLNNARRDAEQANQAKTHFLANMSHEIRTPLNAIMGFTELLLDPESPDGEREQGVAIIRRNGHQLMRIVDEILDISKIEAGGLEIERAPLSFADLWSELRALMCAEASKKNVACAFECETAVPAVVHTDPTRLRQILLNVIGNAIKFTGEGQVSVAARFSVDEDTVGGDLTITVVDSGVGVDHPNVDKIFSPFSQADSSTTRLYGGTGLGLPLSRRLARALGGDVTLVRSEPGLGSTFEVTVRVETAAAAAADQSLAL